MNLRHRTLLLLCVSCLFNWISLYGWECPVSTSGELDPIHINKLGFLWSIMYSRLRF